MAMIGVFAASVFQIGEQAGAGFGAGQFPCQGFNPFCQAAAQSRCVAHDERARPAGKK